MHHYHDEYRHAWNLYKALLGLNLILFKLLLVWVHLCLTLH